jgi:hypothetical protein
MAIDYKGEPAVSTTGTIGATPFVPQPADTSSLVDNMAQQQEQGAGLVERPQPESATGSPQIDLNSLQDDDKRILNVHLTPSLKNVLNKIFGADLFPGIGIGEPTISVSKKIIENRFGSVDKFMSMVKPIEQDEIVPPANTQGILSPKV